MTIRRPGAQRATRSALTASAPTINDRRSGNSTAGSAANRAGTRNA
ncbi:hypothetical protein CU044_2145 [Streptomyces sp. L-9-10]|nr:hypothetical protein CU044_2145 [Streptomyces sp. L-9-10]